MNNKSPTYAPTLEALNSLMLGIALAVIISAVGALLVGLLGGDIWQAATKSLRSDGVAQTILNFFWVLLAAIFSLGFWYAFLLLFALPQYFCLVLPMIKIFSGGLQVDARRSWMFYLFTGSTIGGGPWLVFAWYFFDSLDDLVSLLFVLVPSLCIGLVAGAILKFRLSKLAASSSHLNSKVS
jgi:F0F1-type ATP synthase membrane subunit c/vacuolar-type H+-ATPase subunit K